MSIFKEIPLFVIPLVVFPESKYPLHIFEDRYKKLIRRCIDRNEPFGIITKEQTNAPLFGSLVKVVELSREFPSGEFDIVVKGVSRFKLIYTWKHNDGYLMGNIEEFFDDKNNVNYLLVEELINKFQEMLRKIDVSLEENFWLNLNRSENKSFKLAEKAGLSLEQQQKFLQLRSENERLSFLINQFEKIQTYLEDQIIITKLIMNDGYLN